MTPTQFFTDVCPRLLQANPDACKKVGGTLLFSLRGKDGGNFVVDFASASARAVPSKPSADFTLEMSAADFVRLMSGSLDVKRALRERRVTARGNAELLTGLALLLGAR